MGASASTSATAPPLPPRAVLEVDACALINNIECIKRAASRTGAAVCCVVKANAYGHGLVPVARRMAAEGAPYLGVAYVEEGIMLRCSVYLECEPSWLEE